MQLRIGALAIAFAVALATAASLAAPAPPVILPAPAFTAEQLAAAPAKDWITNGGNLANQRFSPIASLNRINVAGLKAVWRASLGGSGIGPRDAGQAQVLEYDGVVYVVTAEDDVFAIDVDTGKLVWTHKAAVDRVNARPCCSVTSRGVALGDGKILVGQTDAKLVALDQRTGQVIWTVQAEDPKLGYAITSAPLYYDGMVITGFAGGDLGARGRVKAYDAETGALVWTFYTIPGPGEVGHDTWPDGSDVWKHGGAPVWQTPAVDPDLGLLYFSTGNPGPALDGALRAGDNLFTDSIVAVDAKTGHYRWHFQEVHHDLWDYDAANPVVLFDVTIAGKPRKALAQAGKTGWVYLLDRTTGQPLLGMTETPVMQDKTQHTSPTQPFPAGDALVPQSVDIPLEGFDLVNEGRIFTPFGKTPVLYKPQAAVNWPPSAYDPSQHLMFICAYDSLGSAKGGDPDYPVEPGQYYSGSTFGRFQAPSRGLFEALDVTTNRLVWRQQWLDKCYSGAVATAGGVVFVGRNDGRLTALNSSTGAKLWEFQTDAGVNAPATVFEHNGKPYVVVLAGGANLAFDKRGDGVWLFGLDGKIASLPKGSADAAGQFAAPAPPPASKTRIADLAHGKQIYDGACAGCHGDSGHGGHLGGADLTGGLSEETIVKTVAKGRGEMPAFGKTFNGADLQDLAAYIRETLSAPPPAH